MKIQIILDQMCILFLLIFLGYFLYKVKLMNQEFNARLTKLLIHVTTPALVLSSVMTGSRNLSDQEVFFLFVIALIVYLLLPVCSFIITKIIHAPSEDAGIYRFMGTYANVGFMGFPIISALFGEEAVFYAAIFNIVFNISAFSHGILVINKGSSNEVSFSLKRLLTPGILLSIASVVVYFLHIEFPSPVRQAIVYIGSPTIPLAMLILGSTLATINLKELVNDLRLYLFVLIRQIILPLLLWPLCKFAIANELIRNITFILLIMPVANTSVLFATNFNLNEKLAAKGIFLSTLFSILSIPLLIYLCF